MNGYVLDPSLDQRCHNLRDLIVAKVGSLNSARIIGNLAVSHDGLIDSGFERDLTALARDIQDSITLDRLDEREAFLFDWLVGKDPNLPELGPVFDELNMISEYKYADICTTEDLRDPRTPTQVYADLDDEETRQTRKTDDPRYY